jgi:nicotinamidase-related amidase
MYPGSFAETRLDEVLKGWGVKKIVLVGYMAHVCVSTTAREGSQKGYEVVLVEDAIGDRDIPGASGEDVTSMTLKELNDVFGTVIESSDIK